MPKGASSSHQQVQIGTIVRKLFQGHGTFEGVLEGFDPVDCKYRVAYEDGDAEDIPWEKLEPYIVPPVPSEYKAGDEYSFEITPDSYKGMKQILKELGWYLPGMTQHGLAKKVILPSFLPFIRPSVYLFFLPPFYPFFLLSNHPGQTGEGGHIYVKGRPDPGANKLH